LARRRDADHLSRADPTDLDAPREALAASDPEGRPAPLGMSRIELGPEALSSLTEAVSELARGKRVVLVADRTPIEDLRSRALRGGRTVRTPDVLPSPYKGPRQPIESPPVTSMTSPRT